MKIIQSTYQPFLTLDYIVNESENKLFDRKSSRIKPSDLAPIISAFANAEGGTVVIGIDDKTKAIEGLNALDSAMNIVNKYSLKCLEISSLYNQTHKEMSKTKEEEKNNAFPDDFGGANPGSIVLRMR